MQVLCIELAHQGATQYVYMYMYVHCFIQKNYVALCVPLLHLLSSESNHSTLFEFVLARSCQDWQTWSKPTACHTSYAAPATRTHCRCAVCTVHTLVFALEAAGVGLQQAGVQCLCSRPDTGVVEHWSRESQRVGRGHKGFDSGQRHSGCTTPDCTPVLC